MTKNKPRDWEVRERAVGNRGENLWIEAGAGTGKTTLLVARIFSLLTDPLMPVRLSEIAAITFTEKAAGELKVKIRERVEKELAQADEVRRGVLEQALRDLEIAPINTLHGFAQTLLKERPVEARIDPSGGVLDEEAFNRFLGEQYDQWFDEQVQNPTEPLRWYLQQKEFYERQGDWDWLWQVAGRICREHDILLDAKIAADEFVARQYPQLLRRSIVMKEHAQANCRNLDDTAFLNTMQFCEGLTALPPYDGSRNFFDSLAHVPAFSFKSKGSSKNNWSNGGLDENKAMRREAEEIFKRLLALRYTKEVRDLFELAQSFARRFEEEKRKRGVLGFQDLLTRTVDLLRDDKEVRAYFQQRFRYLLIDEFQDTDPLQVQIAFFLCEDGAVADDWRQVRLTPGKLVVVGDPKQSIYRFRRADIEVYEQTKQALLTDGAPLTIDVNFRCAPSIIDTVNRVFAPLMHYDPELPVSPDYVPLQPGREAAPEQARAILLKPDRAPNKGDPHLDWEMQAIGRWIKRAVDEEWPVEDKHSHSLRPIQYRDIAVLFRRRSNFDILENVLRELGVPHRVEGGKVYYQRQEIAALVHGLRALENPDDSLALAQWLGSDLVGFSDEALLLHVLQRNERKLSYADGLEEIDDDIARELRALKVLHEQRNRIGCLATVRSLLDGVGAMTTARLLPHGEVAVANLHKALQAARKADAARLTFGQFAREWSMAHTEEREESDFVLTENSDDVVRLMTIHKAKGLDWPVVIVPELWADTGKTHSKINLLFRRHDEQLSLKLTSGVESELFQSMNENEDQFVEAERVRLLYVAMTRARDYLVLPLFGKVKINKETKIPQKQKGFLEFLVNAGMIDDELKVKDPMGASIEEVKVAELADIEAVRWTLPSRVQSEPLDQAVRERVERMVAERTQKPSPPPVEDVLVFTSPSMHEEQISLHIGGRKDGLLMGSAFHAVMEAIDLADPAAWDNVIVSVASSRHLSESQHADLRRWLGLFAALPSFAELAAAQVYREIPFTYEADGLAYSGKIDLLAETADGLLILDYKTDSLGADDLPARLKAYRRQGEIYRAAVRALLPSVDSVRMVFCFVDLGREVPLD